MFFQGDNISIEFELKKNDGSVEKFSFANYSFNIAERPNQNTCDLQVYEASDTTNSNPLSQAHNNMFLKVVGTKIDHGDYGFTVWVDGQDTGINKICSQPGACAALKGDNFNYDLGTLNVGDHKIQVALGMDINKGVICQKMIPV